MLTVGVRELRNHLSDYLQRVREGERVVVTDRGEPVVELSPRAAGRPRSGPRGSSAKGPHAGMDASPEA